MKPVSVVIVNHNTGKILAACVQEALNQAVQVIVVDNASSDGSLASLPHHAPAGRELEIIEAGENLGFAAACNLGAQSARCDTILFLNPDCMLSPGAVDVLFATLSDNWDAGMVGPLLLNPDGSEQPGGRRAVPTPWRTFVRVFGFSGLRKRYPKLFSDFLLHTEAIPEYPVDVEAISGACMLVTREATAKVGLFDERYFLHCEDLDWCMRFRKNGYRILFVPGARVTHDQGTCGRGRYLFVEWHKHKGMMRFYGKFFKHQYPGPLFWAVGLGVWFRFGVLSVVHGGRRLKRWMTR